MTLQELKTQIKTPVFTSLDAAKYFPGENAGQINIQLARMAGRGDLNRLKRGVFTFPNRPIGDFALAQSMYSPSYISLETALNNYGIIPDIAVSITSITPTTTKNISTSRGAFLYAKIKPPLFFGYQSLVDEESGLSYNLALPEKALLDYIYIRRLRTLADARVDLNVLSKARLNELAKNYPAWVRKSYEQHNH